MKKVFEEVSESPFAFRREILPERIAGDGRGCCVADVDHGSLTFSSRSAKDWGKPTILVLLLQPL
jgi:hypothetical protein